MKMKMDEPTGEVTLPTSNRVGVLARLGKANEDLYGRLAHEGGVLTVRAGRTVSIVATPIEEKMSLPFGSLRLVESMRRTRERGKRL
jgi:hypothetical protein